MSVDIVKPEVNREGWPSGPWDFEPDYDSWRSEHGYPCIARRNRSGAWCGYVGVPPGHPWHGKHYDAVYDFEGDYLEVHGGLTYSDKCRPDIGICHVPEPGESDDFHWLGFDCAHSCDTYPTQPHDFVDQYAIYRSYGYVRSEVEKLARQAHEVAFKSK